jgi:HSP20 family molecular chaperone IbpA
MAQEIAASEKELAPHPDGSEATRARAVYRPRTDIYETEDRVVLSLEMPGVAPDDFDITLDRRVLTIHGRTQDDRHEGYRQVYAEYGSGDYERAFTLSESIDPERIEAEHQDGVLTVMLPKAGPAKAKKIQVRTA